MVMITAGFLSPRIVHRGQRQWIRSLIPFTSHERPAKRFLNIRMPTTIRISGQNLSIL